MSVCVWYFGWALSWEYWRRGMLWLVPAAVGVTVGCLVLLDWEISSRLSNAVSMATDLQHALLPLVLWPPVISAVASRDIPRPLFMVHS